MLSDPRRTAFLLGAAGLVPFFAGAGATVFLDGPQRQGAAFALAAYGAGIVAFLGAVHWGFAIVGRDRAGARPGVFLLAGVVPQLVSWVALLLPVKASLFVLAGAVVAVLGVDLTAVQRGFAPLWWLPLRVGLSAGAGLLLLVGGVFAR